MEKPFFLWEILEDLSGYIIFERDVAIGYVPRKDVTDVLVKRHNEAIDRIHLLEAELMQAENEIDSLEYELEALIDNRSEE